MRISELIIKKRNQGVLTAHEIEYLIQNYVQGIIPDYQMAAFCMAVYFQGMTEEETAHLTIAMANSGDRVDLSLIPGIKVDKHSTGGVADTTTLVLAPLVAAAGVPVAKMSGRGLGHTGGTIDKLEAIPGFNTVLARAQFIEQVQAIQVAIVGQSGNLVPADKKLYALRDVTGTVDSIPLIASSIMSKKIAAGAGAIILDVKTGPGAFMTDSEQAFRLAERMVAIGQQVGRETVALVSDMHDPLGTAIGNALEVEEAILTLQGRVAGPLRELSLFMGSYMLCLGQKAANLQDARENLEKLLSSGKALEKMAQMIAAQGGNPQVVQDVTLLPQAKYREDFLAEEGGKFKVRDARGLGLAAMLLGAGRESKDSVIDLAVGLKLHVRTGDNVEKGQPLVTLYFNEGDRYQEALQTVKEAIAIMPQEISPAPLVLGIVTAEGRELF